MDFSSILMLCLLSYLFFVACVFLFRRFLWRLKKRLGKEPGFYPTTTSLGNAFQNLQVIAQPQVEHVLEEKQEEGAEDDDEGAPKGPAAHLLRQAERIRRGKKVDPVTALLK
jgi:hypothetical protein